MVNGDFSSVIQKCLYPLDCVSIPMLSVSLRSDQLLIKPLPELIYLDKNLRRAVCYHYKCAILDWPTLANPDSATLNFWRQPAFQSDPLYGISADVIDCLNQPITP